MNPTHPQKQNPAARLSPVSLAAAVGLSLLTLAGVPSISSASLWTGGAADNNWNNLSNWDSNPSGGVGAVNTLTAYPIITNNNTLVPNDVDIANASGTTGRIDLRSGTLNFNYWSKIGDWNGNATLNIADTSTSGGTFTGYGQGSGSYVSANAAGNANLLVGLYQSTGVINMNTTGHLDVQNLWISPNGQAGSGTFNLDGGTVNVTDNLHVGSDFWGNGTTSLGYLNISGGTVTANSVSLSRGNNNAASIQGFLKMTGGTLNSRYWFTLGFAGSATAFASVTNSGGTINVNILGGGNMEMCVYDPMSSYFQQNSGSLNLANSAYISFGNGGNNSGTATFDHNGGTVTFYSNSNLTVGGTGYLRLGTGGDSGTYAYNLNGGILTVPNIQRTASGGSGTFNFNGGTLKPTASTATFMEGLTAAYVLTNGAVIDTTNFNITIGQGLLDDGSALGGLTKNGTGKATLTGANTYAGTTAVNGGKLITTTASFASGPVTVADNAGFGVNVLFLNAQTYVTNLTLSPTAGTLDVDLGAFGVNTTAPLLVSNLTANGTITVNIPTGILPSGSLVPLLAYASKTGTGTFTAGTLPPGVVGYISNNITASSIDLYVVSSGTPRWDGTVNGDWDINVTTNWIELSTLAPTVFKSGNPALFDDSATGTKDVVLVTNANPTSTLFTNDTYAYTLSATGANGITGSGGLTKMGTSSLAISNANSYTGPTVIGGGTVIITNDSALGAPASSVTLAGGTLQINGNTTSARTISVSAASTIGVDGGATAVLSGSVTASAAATVNAASGATAQLSGTLTGSGAFAKDGTGTLTVPGNLVTTGQINLHNGSNVVSGVVSNGANLLMADGAGKLATMDVSGGTVAVGGYLVVGANGGDAAVNLSSGAITVVNDAEIGGNSTSGNGTLNISGGSLTASIVTIARGNNNVSTMTGLLNLTGGTVNSRDYFTLGFAGNSSDIGTVTNSGGTINVNTTAGGGDMEMTVFDSAEARFILNSGSLNLWNNSSIIFGAGNNSGIGTLNQNGGNVTFYSDGGTTAGGTGSLILGGTPGWTSSSGTYTYNLNGGVLTTPRIQKTSGLGTGTFNFNGGTLKSTASTATFLQGLTAANVMVNGAIIDTTNSSITIAQALLDGDTLGGGLTKQGSGSLTLSGANTYTGTTLVTNGTLYFTPNHQTATPVVVASGATFGVSTSSATNGATIGNLTLGGAGAGALALSYGLPGNPTNVALTAGAITVNAGSAIQIGGAFSIGTFPMVKYTSLSSLPGLVAPRGTTATISNGVANSTLYAVVTAVGGGIVWTGTNVNAAVSNLWDINVTTNWLTGTTPTKYLEVTPPGDAVFFNDAGTPLVLVSNTVSPLSMTVSNGTASYVFSGNGKISGLTGLTKTGASTARLALTGGNDYTGPTTINGGTLVAAGNGAIGDLSAVTLANVPGASLVISNAETVGSLAGGGASGGNVVMAANLTTGGNNSNTVFGGSVTGAGTFALKGTGSLTVTGAVNVAGEYWVGAGTGDNSTLNIGPGGSLTSDSWLVVGRSSSAGTINVNGGSLVHAGTGNLTLGTLGTTPSGTINLNSGSISNLVGETFLGEGSAAICYGNYNQSGGTAYLGTLRVGRGDWGGSGIGTANITGGTLTVGDLDIGYGNNNTRIGTNVMTIGAGATVNANGFVRLAFAGSTELLGVITNNGGTLNVGTNALYLSYWPDGCSGHVTHNSGALNLRNNSSIVFAQNGSQFSVNDFVQNGGTVTFYSDAGVTVGGTGSLNLGNSGSANNTYTLAGGTLTVPQIRLVSGTGTLNLNGGTIAAAASSTTFMQGLSAANVLLNGVTIDTAGNNITIGQSLLDGDSLGGGLTKIGNGTLTLNGANTYTGATKVNVGTLAGIGSIAGTLTNSATLSPGDGGIGSLTVTGDIALQAGSTNVFDVDGTTPANDSVVAGANVTYGGVLKVVPSGAFTLGQNFTLFSGAGATSASNFSGIEGSPGSGLAFSFTNGVLSVVSGVASNPTNITFSASGGSLSLSWPADHLGWILQAQTNSRAIGLTTGWIDLPGSASVTSTNFPINPADPTVFYRLRIP